MSEKNVIQPQDKYVLRLPDGMRDRLKEAADENGRSMNAEIIHRLEMSFRHQPRIPPDLMHRITIYALRHHRTPDEEILRILEREYPFQWPADARLEHLASLLAMLKSGATDERIAVFIREVEETLEGLSSGGVIGFDEESRKKVASIWSDYKERENWDKLEAQNDELMEYDHEELRSIERNGTTEKFAVRLPDDEFADEMAARDDAETEAYGEELLRKASQGDKPTSEASDRDDPKF